MAFLERLRRWLTMDDAVREMAALQAMRPANATFNGDAVIRPIDQMILEMTRGTGRVSRADALSIMAVLRGRNLICSISTLPLVQLNAQNIVTRNPMLEQIDPDVPNLVTLSQTVEDLLFEGLAIWRITGFGWDRYPTYAQHVAYNRISIQPRAGRVQSPLPAGHDLRSSDAEIYIDGTRVDWSELICFPSPNPALLVAAGRAIRRALLLDQTAELYTRNPRPLDYFTESDSAEDYGDDERQSTLDNWQTARRMNSTGWVPRTVEYHPVDSPSPADLQIVELQDRVNRDIANALGLDPEDLGISTTSRTYQNVTDRRRDRINDVLAPYMQAITDRLSMPDVTKRGYRVTFQLDDYLKADPITRTTYYTNMKALGAITVDEIREEEDLPPLPADAQPQAQPEPQPVPAQQSEPANVVALRKSRMSFGKAEHTFVNVPVMNFKVDREQRTIEGLALPYNEVASKFGTKFRFAPGALQLSEMSRNKLLRDHDYAQALGVLTHTQDQQNGVFVRYKVARGPEGDQALSLAEDGVLDGFSVGVDFDEAVDTVPDPSDKTVVLIRRADWRETSLTAMPAFDGARVTKVAASRDGGKTVDDTTTEPTPVNAAPAVAPASAPAQINLSVEPGTPFGELFMQMVRTGQIDAGAFVTSPPRPVVNPTRSLAATRVNEARPYRFDRKGNLLPGSHDFSSDIIKAFTLAGGIQDTAAHDRVMEFIRAQFDVITTDVDELNPNRQRPDMFVDQREFLYPIWSAANKGTLQDVTPFVFPKFNSSGSLVADHTQGNEPSSGTYTTTGATVTPTPVSGKIKTSREAWDQGGNPQMSGLIWRQMLRAWYEALESYAVTTLNAASLTCIVTGAGSMTDSTLDQALAGAFAGLQFTRGGFSMDNFVVNQTLYTNLVKAKDGNNRRLFPMIAPQNAVGTTAAKYAAVDVGGLIGRPAWALTTKSYIFDTDAVSGWATAPQRLDITATEVANVYIGLWGYKAFVVNDVNGLKCIS